MIRIDEIYNNTFWPWLKQNRPGTRLFFCDPPGRTDPDALFNLGRDDVIETDYVFMHDQEPVWLDLHEPLFQDVVRRNLDMNPVASGHVVTSERGQQVKAMCDQYGWTSHYYFYHGWACQDWFRGYDRSFVIPRARQRSPTRTFMSPNRIVAGKRDHRVLFLYHVFRSGLGNNHISAPKTCPAELADITSIAQKYTDVYQDISTVLDQAELPKLFAGEHTQEMTSCWLSNFEQAQDSLFYVPTETVYFGDRTHLTEKTFKAIALEMPFVLVAPAGSLEYLREYGFKTFAGIIDETYDQETNDILRIERVTKVLADLENLSQRERQQIHQACLPMVEHNYNHFYKGGFSDVLWQELMVMLNGLTV